MSVHPVPKDRSLRAYKLACQHLDDGKLGSDHIRELIMSEGIDEPTAMEALASAHRDRQDRWAQHDKFLAFASFFSIMACVAAIAQRSWEWLLIIPLAGTLGLITRPWGKGRAKAQ